MGLNHILNFSPVFLATPWAIICASSLAGWKESIRRLFKIRENLMLLENVPRVKEMSSKYTSRIKAKPRKRKRRGGSMTEEGRDMYDFVRPASKRAATYARKGVNTLMNHGEELANIATSLAGTSTEGMDQPAGGAMTEEGRDMYHSVRPVFGKRPARMARKAVNTVMNHGEGAMEAAGTRQR